MYIIHLIGKEILNQPEEYGIYETIYADLLQKYDNSHVHFFVKSQKPLDNLPQWQAYSVYKNYADLLQQVQSLHRTDLFITTITEALVSSMHKLKRDIRQQHTKKFNLFTNKAKERTIIWEVYPETVPNAVMIDKTLPLKPQIAGLDFPLMLKPIAWVGSRGVMKSFDLQELKDNIENLDKTFNILAAKGIHNEEYIIEEFIDWPQFVINYWVDDTGKYYLSLPTHVKTTQEIDIEWYGNRYRLITKDIYDYIDKKSMTTLIEKTIDAWHIRNTYISHNFRITSNNKYKTIEINWRIWWYRLEMNRESAWYNLFDVSLDTSSYKEPKIQKNVMVMSIWAHKTWRLKWFNEELIERIQDLPSYKSSRLKQQFKNKKVTFATNGWQTLWTIVCVHEDQQQFEKDIMFIEQQYKEICMIT